MERAQYDPKRISEIYTKRPLFLFCGLCPKALEYKEIDAARILPSVTFETARRQASEHEGRGAEETHHDAEHKRDGVM